MAIVNVQFSDTSMTTIIASFGSPQDAAVYTNQGTVETDDARWAEFYAKFGNSVLGLPSPSESSGTGS